MGGHMPGEDKQGKEQAEPGYFPETQWTLLEQAGRGQSAALGSFVQVYQPIICFYLMSSRKVSRQQAEELAQDFMTDRVVEKNMLQRADRTRGRKFRYFLFKVLNRYVVDRWRQERAYQKNAAALDEEAIAVQGDDSPIDQAELEYARHVIGIAVERFRASSERDKKEQQWKLFEVRILPAFTQMELMPYEEVVARFGFESPEQAHDRMVTVKRAFRRCLETFIGEYLGTDDPEAIRTEIAELTEILSRRAGSTARQRS